MYTYISIRWIPDGTHHDKVNTNYKTCNSIKFRKSKDPNRTTQVQGKRSNGCMLKFQECTHMEWTNWLDIYYLHCAAD